MLLCTRFIFISFRSEANSLLKSRGRPLSLKDNYLCALDIVAGLLLKIFQCTSKDRYNNLYLQARLQLERILKSVRISKNSVTKEGGLRCLPLSCFGIPSCLALALAGRGARPSRKPSGPTITGDLSLAEGHSH